MQALLLARQISRYETGSLHNSPDTHVDRPCEHRPVVDERVELTVALQMDRPQRAAVFCVDEKTAIQALERLDPVLPMSTGRAERHGFEYYQHGTLSLYAGPG